jgi:ATP-dependent helicase/nuclease subunit A
VILDYKTDRVKDPDRLIRLYKKQLDLYERALVQMRIPVKEKLIYSFELGMTIRIQGMSGRPESRFGSPV